MSVRITGNPGAEPINPREEFVGRPIAGWPHIMICTAAEPGARLCGKTWVARDELDYLRKTAERRDHEATCRGGLILPGGIR